MYKKQYNNKTSPGFEDNKGRGKVTVVADREMQSRAHLCKPPSLFHGRVQHERWLAALLGHIHILPRQRRRREGRLVQRLLGRKACREEGHHPPVISHQLLEIAHFLVVQDPPRKSRRAAPLHHSAHPRQQHDINPNAQDASSTCWEHTF